MKKNVTICFRTTEQEKKLIIISAKKKRQSITQYIIACALSKEKR